MRARFILITLIATALGTISCFKGETGPTGPAGKNGIDGPRGPDGVAGVSVIKPHLTGLFRVFLKGVELPLNKTDVDSSQYLFLSETWTFRLYKLNTDSCIQVNRGNVEWGGSTIVMTDTNNISYSFTANGYNSGSYFSGSLPDDLLNCLKCELRPVSTCTQTGKPI